MPFRRVFKRQLTLPQAILASKAKIRPPVGVENQPTRSDIPSLLLLYPICRSELCCRFKTTVKSGTPEGTRIPNLLIRSQTLYPIELRVR